MKMSPRLTVARQKLWEQIQQKPYVLDIAEREGEGREREKIRRQ